jgi:hypothetical protein
MAARARPTARKRRGTRAPPAWLPLDKLGIYDKQPPYIGPSHAQLRGLRVEVGGVARQERGDDGG